MASRMYSHLMRPMINSFIHFSIEHVVILDQLELYTIIEHNKVVVLILLNSIAYETALTLNGRKLKITPSKSQTSSSVIKEKTIEINSIEEQKTRVVHCKRAKYTMFILV